GWAGRGRDGRRGPGLVYWRAPVTTSEYDSVRPPERPGRGRGGGNGRRRARPAGADGSRETPVVPEAEFTSYYGRPVVKPAPWGHDIAGYLFLGGVAGGSALLAAGGELTGGG